MRKIIVTEFITLDGVIEAPGGNETNHPHGGWQTSYDSKEAGKYKIDELASADALLLGRKTYDVFAAYWPSQNDEFFGKPINRLPKYVVSTTMQKADWNNSTVLHNVATDIAALKKTDGGNILVYGSGTLVKSLIHHDLVDELRLMLYPVIVGGGISLFDDKRELKKFSLSKSRMVDGILILEYVPAS